jgi:fructosamine-3-kinase
MSADRALLEQIAAVLGEDLSSFTTVSGGSINAAWRLELGSGRPVFVKARSGAPAAEFAAESAGLAWLRQPGEVAVPEVLATGEGDPPWLALEWIEPGSLSRAGTEELGRGLAALHRAGAEAHGALPPGSPDEVLRIGSVALPSRPGPDWPELYAEQRLRPLLAMALDRGAIGEADAEAVELVCERIEVLAGPPEPPSRLHGDLWGGNVLAGADGGPWLIDPAAHGGHREIDLAMLRLFGGPGERAFAAYEEARPLPEGHAERIDLWQLLPLLVHAVLFGGSYGSSAGRAARHYN